MENKLHIWQTAKDSLAFVYHHYKGWLRVASGPFLLMLLSGIFVSLLRAETGPSEVGFWGLIFLVSMAVDIVAYLMFTVGGYRYAMYEEGGLEWFKFRFDHVLFRVFLYSALIMLLIGGGTLAVGFITKTIHSLLTVDILTVLVGILGVIAVVYLLVRFVFVIPFAAIGLEKPLKNSLEISKGRILRLTGLFLLVFVALMIFTSLLGGGLGFIVELSGTGVLQDIVITVVQALLSLFSQAVIMTTSIFAYKRIIGR